MKIEIDEQLKTGLLFGGLAGIACIFIFPSPLIGLILGTIITTLIARPPNRKQGAAYGALASYLIFILALLVRELGNFSALDFGFAYFDHLLYLLIFGGLLSMVVGAICGAVIGRIFSL